MPPTGLNTHPGRTAPMKLHLYDDGTHGDAVANDGIYTNRIADTPKEGTYSLHIRASGRTDWGIFERDKVIQKHLKPRVSSRYVLVKVTAVATTVPRLRRFKIIVTPKDALGNHLGAGYGPWQIVCLLHGTGCRFGIRVNLLASELSVAETG